MNLLAGGEIAFGRSLERMTENATVTCPECLQRGISATRMSAWPAKARGKRTCPNCGTVLRLSRQGVTVVHPPRPTVDLGYNVPEWARLYRVVEPYTGTLLCAGCARPHSISTMLDGRAGHVRGMFCPTCQSSLAVHPVGRMAVDTRPLRVRSVNFNGHAQRLAYEDGLVAIDNAQRNGLSRSLADEATALVGANWAHTGELDWLVRDAYTSVQPECLRPEPLTFDPITELDNARYRGPLSRTVARVSPTGVWDTALAVLMSFPLPSRTRWNRTSPATSTPFGTFLRLPACRAGLGRGV